MDPKKTGKRKRKPTQLDRSSELAALKKVIYRMIDRRYKDHADATHSALVGMDGKLSARMTSLEARLPASPAEPKEPKFKAGDWVVSDFETAILKAGVPHKVKSVSQYGLTFDIGEHNDISYVKDHFRPATPEEIASYEASEQKRKEEERKAAELAKPLEFGTRVKVEGSAQRWAYVKLRAHANEHLVIAEDSTLLQVTRDQFTIIP